MPRNLEWAWETAFQSNERTNEEPVGDAAVNPIAGGQGGIKGLESRRKDETE